MVEVDVAGLEDAHDLDTFDGFAVEGDGRGGDDLGEEALEGCWFYMEVAAID